MSMPYESMPMPSAPPAPYSETAPLVPWGFDYARVKSNNAVNYDSFTGDIEFTVNASESERSQQRTRICQLDYVLFSLMKRVHLGRLHQL